MRSRPSICPSAAPWPPQPMTVGGTHCRRPSTHGGSRRWRDQTGHDSRTGECRRCRQPAVRCCTKSFRMRSGLRIAKRHFRFTAESGSTAISYITCSSQAARRGLCDVRPGSCCSACLDLASLLMAPEQRARGTGHAHGNGRTRRGCCSSCWWQSFHRGCGHRSRPGDFSLVGHSLAALLFGGQS